MAARPLHDPTASPMPQAGTSVRYTNAGQLVNQDAASDDFGMMLRNAEGDLGLLAERWYFFAQANHPQNLYYQVIS